MRGKCFGVAGVRRPTSRGVLGGHPPFKEVTSTPGAQWSKMGGEDAINSNDSFMPSKWYQIEGLIKRNSNLTKKI